jgi:hypothetical protein
MVSVAYNDHNLPDMRPEMQQGTVESMVRSHLSLMDLLNPAYGSESEDDLAADELSDDGAGVNLEQDRASEGEASNAMTLMRVDGRSLSDPMDTDTTYGGVPNHTTSLLEDTEDCSSQADSRMTIEHEALTVESGISSARICDPPEGSKSSSKKTRQTSLASFFYSSTSSTSNKRHAPSLDDATSERHNGDSDRRKRPRSEGKSKSAMASRTLREKFRTGKLEVDENQLGGWQTKIIEEDPDAEFDEKNIFSARHSGCGA